MIRLNLDTVAIISRCFVLCAVLAAVLYVCDFRPHPAPKRNPNECAVSPQTNEDGEEYLIYVCGGENAGR